MIQTLIASLASDGVLLTRSSDRGQITKLLRQGGRRLWIDAVSADEAEREWIAECFKLPGRSLEWGYPFARVLPQEQGVMLRLQQASLAGNRWALAPVFILVKNDLMLTLRPTQASVVNEAFLRAEQNPTLWQGGVLPLFSQVVEGIVSQLELTGEPLKSEYDLMNLTLARGASPSNSSEDIQALYQKRLLLDKLVRIVDSNLGALSIVGEWALIHQDQSIALQFQHLISQCEELRQSLARHLAPSWELTTALERRQNAELTRLVRGIEWLLAVLLPPIAAALVATVLHLPDPWGGWLAVFGTFALYGVCYMLIRQAQ